MMAQKSEPSCTQTGNDRTQSWNVVDVVAAAIGRAIEEMGDEFDANRHECLKTWTDFEVAQAINGPNYTLVPRDFYERLAKAALEAMADCSRPANKGETRTSDVDRDKVSLFGNRAGEHCRIPECPLLLELYSRTPMEPRDYWLMTEVYVALHGGDSCLYESRQSGAIDGPTIPPGWRITGPDACPACRGTGRSEPLPDFEGDDPKTMTVCTVSLCQLCGGSGVDPNYHQSITPPPESIDNRPAGV